MAIIALLIIAASLWYTNRLVKSIAEQETRQVKMWAAAMEQQAIMMKSTEEFFNKVSEQEQLRVDLLANAYRRVIDISTNENTSSPTRKTTSSFRATCRRRKKARRPSTAK